MAKKNTTSADLTKVRAKRADTMKKLRLAAKAYTRAYSKASRYNKPGVDFWQAFEYEGLKEDAARELMRAARRYTPSFSCQP